MTNKTAQDLANTIMQAIANSEADPEDKHVYLLNCITDALTAAEQRGYERGRGDGWMDVVTGNMTAFVASPYLVGSGYTVREFEVAQETTKHWLDQITKESKTKRDIDGHLPKQTVAEFLATPPGAVSNADKSDAVLSRLADVLVEDILAASDEEILQEVRDDGLDVEEEASKVRAVIKSATPESGDYQRGKRDGRVEGLIEAKEICEYFPKLKTAASHSFTDGFGLSETPTDSYDCMRAIEAKIREAQG